MTAAPLLALDAVDAGYGPFRAIFGVSLTIGAGQAVAMLGANGAGKTTVARVCTGLVRPTSGTITFDGHDVRHLATHHLAQAGVAHAPEGRSVFATLTVEENLALSFRQQIGRNGYRAAIDRACELFPRLAERRRQLAGTLSGGEQRMLALARVLVLSPRLLVADELSLGLAPVTVDEVYQTLTTIKAEGTAVLVIEQHVQHALELADEAVVLRHGEVAYHGTASEVAAIGDQLLPRADAPEAPLADAVADADTDTDTESSGTSEPDPPDASAQPPGRSATRHRPLSARSRPHADPLGGPPDA